MYIFFTKIMIVVVRVSANELSSITLLLWCLLFDMSINEIMYSFSDQYGRQRC